MLTGRASDIFEISDEPLGDDDLRETAESHADDLEHAGASPAASVRTRSRLFALGCLIAGAGALVAALPREGERPANPVETHASAPSPRTAHAHVQPTRAPRRPRDARRPGPERAESRRTAASVLPKRAALETRAAPSGTGDGAVPLTASSAPSDARQRVLAEPYEEFGFER